MPANFQFYFLEYWFCQIHFRACVYKLRDLWHSATWTLLVPLWTWPFCLALDWDIEYQKEAAQSLSHVWLFATLWTVTWQPPLSMGFSHKNIGVAWHFFLQGIFPTQGLNPHLLHCMRILYAWATKEAHQHERDVWFAKPKMQKAFRK